jgi:hypothetical protein
VGISRKRSFLFVLSGLLSLTVTANTAFSASAATAPSVPRTHAHSPTPTVITSAEVAQLLAQARQIADARLRAEGLSPAGNRPRIGWFIPVDCYCLQANEKTFQDALQITAFDVAAPLDHMSVRVQPHTYMKLNSKSTNRIPDIYYFRLNKAHPAQGLGYLNELKVGDQAMGRAGSEALYDHKLYIQGHGIGANAFDRGQYLPVTAVLWWFAPDVDGITYYNAHFLAYLLALGINIVYMVQNSNAPPWPRREGKQQEAKDVKEFESNNRSSAQAGLDNMIAPCVYTPTCPSP